jgi:hypothetical protein
MAVPTSIIVAALIVAASVTMAFRWQVTAGTNVVYIRDNWTGSVIACPTPAETQLTGRALRAKCDPE